jgi:hypothetical protein
VSCTHEKQQSTWVPEHEDDFGGIEPGHWHYETVGTSEDIDIGRFRCTQCGAVGYYTGLWRAFHEEGKPCVGSERQRPAGKPEKRW